MKLKSLLLGSAAAMIAVTGARAADAVIAEPEPVEYVRVCDLYGAGFFYIPGTETCLNINGYIRVDFTYNDEDSIFNQVGGTTSNDASGRKWFSSAIAKSPLDAGLPSINWNWVPS